jgi:hypothetical protein
VLEHAAESALASACVRVLFDQGTPVPLRETLGEHDISTAYERGWSTLKNSDVLRVLILGLLGDEEINSRSEEVPDVLAGLLLHGLDVTKGGQYG